MAVALFFIVFYGLVAYWLFIQGYMLSKLRQWQHLAPQLPYLPKVSILIAVRNEAHTLKRCLAALAALTYPQKRLEIWIANDASEDETAQLLRSDLSQAPHFRVLTLPRPSAGDKLKGKARALAALTAVAQGEVWLFTDADVAVPPDWVQHMVAPVLHERADIVTGFTQIDSSSGWRVAWQQWDWARAQLQIAAAAAMGIPLTTMGNNMALAAGAYRKYGGWETLPFSVAEDWALFRAWVNKGARFRHLIADDIQAVTLPEPSYKNLLAQRRRWAVAALHSPWYVRLLLGMILLQPLVWLWLLWLYWPAALALAMLQWLYWQQLFARHTKLGFAPWGAITYWPYQAFLPWRLLWSHLCRRPVVWKGRYYAPGTTP
ncbi:glycosyltransferase [Eisenibacter elegans]|uniref:glycosyltransferase n=1 Tax=Eisenibacter elegans TaxID=997 RepID=UPI0003FE3A25|nr:glycosyltransferase [Eisenibacter elegans]